jgi:hypothetical protein
VSFEVLHACKRGTAYSYTSAGYPIVTVPLGFFPEGTEVVYNDRKTLVDTAPNVPFGLSFLGRRFSEEKLIAYACAFEAATQVRNKGPKPYIVGPSFTLRSLSLRSKLTEIRTAS